MERYIEVLKGTKLFEGIDEAEIRAMLGCLDAKIKTFRKGEYVYRQGDEITDITMLAAGELHILNEDYWGNGNIISTVSVGEMFGESYVTPSSGTMLNSVMAVSDSVVMYFDAKRIITTCPSACKFHSMVVQNLFYAISDKNRKLVQKLGHMSQRSTREKLMSYLSEAAKRDGSNTFEIPFNRQQLADFLSVDRSAMSSELSKMRVDGLIEYEKNKFTLIEMF